MKIDINVPGHALAMRVLQSDLYDQLDDKERAECDALITKGQALMNFEFTPHHVKAAMNWWDLLEPKQKQMLTKEHGTRQFASATDISRFWILQHPTVASNMEEWK